MPNNTNSSTFENGYILASNARFIAGVFSFLLIISVFGIIFLPIAIFFLFAKNRTIIDFENKVIIKELILFSINIKSKKTSLNNYQYISTIPSKETQTFQSRSGRVSSDTTYFSSVTLYKKRLRGGLEINKYRSTKESTEVALELSKKLEIAFFTYSPKVIREKMRE